LFSISYTPETNPIEALFNQLKHYLKFEGIKREITNAFKKIKKKNYKNYFLYTFDKENYPQEFQH